MSQKAGPSRTPIAHTLSGTIPGALDPTQPDRLLRSPGSTLSFAVFDSSTAVNTPHKPVDDKRFQKTRIVIETPSDPSGPSTWRFVPHARLEWGAQDEGSWPRVVDICGELALCSQDQWDIYKLDPVYECVVHARPRLTTIHRKDSGAPTVDDNPLPAPDEVPDTPPSKYKRPASTSPNAGRQKRARTTIEVPSTSSSDEEGGPSHPIDLVDSDSETAEVEEIIADDWYSEPTRKTAQANVRNSGPSTAPPSRHRHRILHEKRRRDRDERNRLRRERNAFYANAAAFDSTHHENVSMADASMADASMADATMVDPDEFSSQNPPKRKGRESPEDVRPPATGNPHKRTRTVSPQPMKAGKPAKRKDLGAEFKDRLHSRNHAFHETFFEDIRADVPEDSTHTSAEAAGQQEHPATSSSTTDDQREHHPHGPSDRPRQHKHSASFEGAEDEDEDEKARRRAAIEESMRKLAELERDQREQEARERRAREHDEETQRQANREQQTRSQQARRQPFAHTHVHVSSGVFGTSMHGPGGIFMHVYNHSHTPQMHADLAQQERLRRLRDQERLRREMREETMRQQQARAQAQAEQMRREMEAKLRQQQARAQQQREARARQQQEQEQAARAKASQQQRWSYAPWTPQRALERYRSLCAAFDANKFTSSAPITFDTIPWPVLHSPAALSLDNIDWSAVETFFKTMKTLMRVQDYKTFVVDSHKRFHPDRWRARGVLKSVENENVRNRLEVAANTVAQALTPLWTEVKG